MESIVAGVDRLSNTTKLGTHYAMMLNSRDDINHIIQNISKQKEIINIRIYNKDGQIKFSNSALEVDKTTNIKDEACYICHRTNPPMHSLDLYERIRIFDSPEGYRLLGIISPIYNEPSCSTDACHVHPKDKKVLGALDIVVSLEEADKEIFKFEKGIIVMAILVFILSAAIVFYVVLRFVNYPIQKLIEETKHIAKGDYSTPVDISEDNEIGQLASAITHMSKEISAKQAELNRQRDEYQLLFEQVPCIITVQDKNYRLVKYNREFAEKFAPKLGDYCYHAYKGRTEKCVVCPVEKTFEDGLSHYSEESGVNKDGKPTYWIVNTTPIHNESGEIVAAMEMCLDITQRRQLEEKLELSEKKYYAIFNNMPNPVFVMDYDSYEILDCNESVKTVYGYEKNEIKGKSFLDLFHEDDRTKYASKLRSVSFLDKVKHMDKEGKRLFVNIRVSPSEYPGQKVILASTSDITKRLEAEQQLSQASKMATLGEMATGVAHELNQPLTVMKTASSFLLRKLEREEKIEDEILMNMVMKINSNVDRATKIINHMRQFARKSELTLEKTQINTALEKAFDIFSQQLKVRGIEVNWNLQSDLPMILADPGRLEQVFINLLINARDAIEERWGNREHQKGDKQITITTRSTSKSVIIEIQDTGTGIPEHLLGKIFEPFYTTKEVGKGTGLGLSISYGIVKDFQGEIEALPNIKNGACFRITFPIAA